MARIVLRGDYRVQSRLDYAASTLQGRGLRAPGLIDNRRINRALRQHPLWAGRAHVALRPAHITLRSGKFASEPDILYKRDLFVPAAGTPPMTEDIVDVLKSRHNWAARLPYLGALFPVELPALLRRLGGLEQIIANEYMLHEAGHFIGYDVYAKQRDGYFHPGGRTAWPLIYLEELRADLNAFGFALRLMPPRRAVAIFLYNLLLRFGVHREGWLRQGNAPYGLVPYLLYCLLEQSGLLAVAHENGRARFVLRDGCGTTRLIAAMRACARHADQQLNLPELAAGTPIERALAAAQYVRRRMADQVLAQKFRAVMQQAANDEERP